MGRFDKKTKFDSFYVICSSEKAMQIFAAVMASCKNFPTHAHKNQKWNIQMLASYNASIYSKMALNNTDLWPLKAF